MIHLDACFLIDLMREEARERPGPAFDAIEILDEDEILCSSVHVVCELRAGAELARQPLKEHERLDRMLSGILICMPDDRLPPLYARLFASTRRGAPMASMDLLIAAAALLDDAPLLTKNVKHFSRVPGLRIIKY